MTDRITRICARVGVVAMVAMGASACSSVPDWVDPTTWVGGGSSSNTPAPDPDADVPSGESPDLASIPDRPNAPSTATQQQQIASSLASDRSDAKYSADALRGGTEPVAAPPPPAPPPERVVEAPPPTAKPAPAPKNTKVAENKPNRGVFGTSFDAERPAPPPDSDADINANTGETSPASAPAADTSVAQVSPPPPQPAPVASAELAPPPAPAPQAAMTPAPQRVAMAQTAMTQAAPPPAPMPHSGMPTMAEINPSDAALGFRPSSAPPLDSNIGQFVPQPIIARYDQTAAGAHIAQPQIASAAPAPRARSTKAMGGPEMSGAVVANLDAIQSAPQTQPAAYANPQGLPPNAVVFFPGDGTLLSAEGRLRIRAAVEEFKQRGGTGYIRVVGHSSSRTSNMPVEKHLEFIFNKSQDRANVVAQEMIKEGVPANRVLVEAVGDSQPVYYESMPKGEDGNRRAEIFLQS
jgi:outer membrane protein OmpA-like peptidoglycan-associated protein